MLAQEAVIFELLNRQKVTRFYSSEEFGKQFSRALNDVNRRVDMQRLKYAISGTKQEVISAHIVSSRAPLFTQV